MTEIRYNFAQLNAAADDINSTMGNMTNELEGLKQGLQPLLSTWEGEAQAAYYKRQSEWETAANDIRDLLGKIGNALRQSASTMQAREKANMAKFGG